MNINTEHLNRCIQTLEAAFEKLQQHQPSDIVHDIYRAACVKEFEIVLEQSGRLLKKCLSAYFATNREADRLTFKDIFRYAAKHEIITSDACQRWLRYRDNRNDTVHDYGAGFAKITLKLLPRFISDAKSLEKSMKRHLHD